LQGRNACQPCQHNLPAFLHDGFVTENQRFTTRKFTADYHGREPTIVIAWQTGRKSVGDIDVVRVELASLRVYTLLTRTLQLLQFYRPKYVAKDSTP